MSELFTTLQKVLPQHGLSRLAGRVAASETVWLKNLLIRQFARWYPVDMSEAERPALAEYRSFNDFFTRALKPQVRSIASQPDAVVCPADGAVSQLGAIESAQLIQAKGHSYSIHSLAGALGAGFDRGSFCTIYLAPHDYHRVHQPFDGTLVETLAVPGALFSVNAATEQSVDGLFARNERLVCRFDTDFGPMLVVLVGAMIVASIATDWVGPQSPYQLEERSEHHLVYRRGEEIGRFLLGSTVICCFPQGSVALDPSLRPGSIVRMGQLLARRL